MFRGQQTRVLLLNDMERLERTLFRLEQGRSSQKLCIADANIFIYVIISCVIMMFILFFYIFFV